MTRRRFSLIHLKLPSINMKPPYESRPQHPEAYCPQAAALHTSSVRLPAYHIDAENSCHQAAGCHTGKEIATQLSASSSSNSCKHQLREVVLRLR
ncbi:hypothetical protein U9M48_037220 [Paspalum notatum var. saurae]|uniref:Uncharacterized protein n=1 Tax=Paspalum notatum var. saurae TaxID=547442 RepID=A0AAQ3UGM0_PASNO